MKWYPIETAPKDGSAVILFDGEDVVIGLYSGEGDYPWTFFDPEAASFGGAPLSKMVDSPNPGGPILWMPFNLPEPPRCQLNPP